MPLKNQQKLIYLIVILAVVVAAVWFLKKQRVPPPGSEPAKQTTPAVIREALPQEQLPKNFPADFPLIPAEKTEIVQNDNVTVEGKQQGRRQFVSDKTLEENYQLYKDYMQKTAWLILSDINEPDYKSLIGRQGSQVLSVSISKNAESGGVIINAVIEY